MTLKKKILILSIFIIFISIIGVSSSENHQNTNDIVEMVNESDLTGCCSIVLQLEDYNNIMSFRRDSNLDADIHIEKVDWHGKQAVKQYKESDGYFCHVIITQDGWVIGMGGIDDGIDSEKCENITASMISDDYNISKDALKDIQNIKKPYNRGHVLVKAPNGNYGIATVDKIVTGKLEPGEYISIPNNYSYFRSGNISLNTDDKIEKMNELAQSDLYGFDRRDITTYYSNISDNDNNINIFVSNEDGSKLGVDYTGCVDDVYVNDTFINASDIPIAPNYKNIGSFSLNANSNILITVLFGIGTVIFIGILSFGVYRLIRFIKYEKRP